MGYEVVEDQTVATVVKLGGVDNKTGKKFPTRIEGYYAFKKNVNTKNGPAVIHAFKTPAGLEGIWGTAQLNKKLGQVRPGTMTEVTYTGKEKIPGGKTMLTYSVRQDSSNVDESLTKLPVGIGTAFADDDMDTDPVLAAQEDNSAEEDAYQAAALAAAERKAKVDALLKGSKGTTFKK